MLGLASSIAVLKAIEVRPFGAVFCSAAANGRPCSAGSPVAAVVQYIAHNLPPPCRTWMLALCCTAECAVTVKPTPCSGILLQASHNPYNVLWVWALCQSAHVGFR